MINAAVDFDTPEQRAALHVNAAMAMVRQLPKFAHDGAEASPSLLRVACLESFLTNLRLLIEFLTRSNKKDWSASDFLDNWSPEPSDELERVAGWWALASQHVAHLSKERTPQKISDIKPLDTSLEALEQVARDCDAIFKAFVHEIKANQHPVAEHFSVPLV